MTLKILVGCEFSGIVRDAFINEGYNAVSCDLLPSESPGPHHQGDLMEILNDKWDLAIFHPPCTRLCNSGVRWLHERDLWTEMKEGAEFFLTCLNAPIKHIAVENPIMHKYARELIQKDYDQKIQPYWFGDTVSKQTCLWLKNLPALKPTKILPLKDRHQTIFKEPPSKNRWKNRSRFHKGIAQAMASQWGKYVLINSD